MRGAGKPFTYDYKMNHKGIFVTFEGGDGAGKTTLIEKLYADLHGRSLDVMKTRAPGGTPLGQEVRSLLLEKREIPLSKRAELLLFLADRAQHVDEVISPALESQKIVLCDRFNDSTIAYQGGARGFGEEIVRSFCRFASNALVPDLTLYLDLDPKIGFERTKHSRSSQDRIESEALHFHNQIRSAFHHIAKIEPKRFILLDASLPPEEVFRNAKEKIDALLNR